RYGNGAFWGLLATSFLFGSRFSDLGNGVLVLALVILGGFGGIGLGKPATTTPEERGESARRRGNRLFLPALIIPVTALLGTLFLKPARIGGITIVDAKQVT